MSRLLKKRVFIIGLFIFSLFFFPKVKASTLDYIIDAYDVNIRVNEDNSYDITETIKVYFYKEKHGIYRIIPLKNTVNRLDGTSSTNRVHLTNLEINNQYTTSRENNNYIIRIGKENETVTGSQTYSLHYKYDIGRDPLKDIDEFYYNIIGTDWDTSIKSVTFTITMPKEFDTSKLGFSQGSYGTVGYPNGLYYQISENKITGGYYNTLNAGEALTVRIELEEGYFTYKSPVEFIDYVLYGLPIVFAGISLYLWRKYGKKEPIVETIEFYPPDNLNSLEIGYLYKGSASIEEVTSLLIYLANKGYLQISETEKKNFKITKLKDYDGNDENERLFMEGLFKTKKKEVEEVTKSDLTNHFYKTTEKILSKTNTKEHKNKIFDKTSKSKKKYIILMIILSYIFIIIRPILLFGMEDEIFVLFFVFPFSFMFLWIVYMCYNAAEIDKKTFLIFLVSFGGIGLFLLIIGFIFTVPLLSYEKFYLFGFLIDLIAIMIMGILIQALTKRTPYGSEMLGKIKGFKTFLKTAEKEKLEAMVEEDPMYFYDILPYAYVLGVSKTWMRKFEEINLSPPEWYYGNNDFNFVAFHSFINNTMSSASQTMASSPSSGSSGFSGGGFSGGGSGGGGGGSW